MQDEATYKEVRKSIRAAAKEGKTSTSVRVHSRLVVGLTTDLQANEYIVRTENLAGETVRIDVSWSKNRKDHI